MKQTLLKTFALIAFLSAGLTSCSSDDSGTSQNLLEVANANGLTSFVEAVQTAGLTNLMESNMKRTVFVPSNIAMTTYLSQNGYASFADVPADKLRELLKNHFIDSEISSLSIQNGYKKTLAHGSASATNFISIFFGVDDEDGSILINGSSLIATANVAASNGKIHIVNRVLELPKLYDFISADPAIVQFHNAINTDVSLINTLSQPGLFTVFAPWNDGLQELSTEMGYTSIGGFTPQQLHTLVNYHVVQGQNKLLATFNNGDVLPTLAGQNVSVTVSGAGRNLVDANNRVVPFTSTSTTDIQADNGVMQIIRRALKPQF